ncbi:MAG TPA: hypothetical protein VII72_08420 [Myxococcota bacterium]|jgi:hypothetical protein
MPPAVKLLVSIDTEEDNWRPVREGITLENLRELPRLHRFLRELGLRPTYFVDHPVASTPWTLEVLRGIAGEGGGEIGAHLHPWNTPPLREEFTEANTMLRNLPPDLQRAKLETLREALRAVSGRPPTSFRAGRFGLGRETVAALIETGFDVDSSVTPFVSWAAYGGGSDFDGAPIDCYRLDGRGDPRIPAPAGRLREVPLSCGFTRRPFARVAGLYRRLTSEPLRRIPLASLATRAGLVRRVIGSPETNPVHDLLALARCLLGEGARFLHVFFHSPSLLPGLSPFVQNEGDRERFYRSVAQLVEGLARIATLEPTTVSECADALCPAAQPAMR